MNEIVLGALISGIIGLISAFILIFIERKIFKYYEKKNLRDKLLRIHKHLNLESRGNLFSVCSLFKNIGEDIFFEWLKIEVGILGLGLDAYHVELNCDGWFVVLQKAQYMFKGPNENKPAYIRIKKDDRTDYDIEKMEKFKEVFKKKCIDSKILKERHFKEQS